MRKYSTVSSKQTLVLKSLFTSCTKDWLALLAPSCCIKFGTCVITSCSKSNGIVTLVTRLL